MIIPKHVGVGIYIQKREEAEPKIQTPEMGDARSQNEPPAHHAGWTAKLFFTEFLFHT